MRARIKMFFGSVFLAILISAAPVALVSATEKPATVEHAAVKAEAVHGATQGAGTGHAAAAKDGGHGGGLAASLAPEKLKDLFWRTVNFLALVVLLVKFAGKPISAGLGGRQQQIKDDLEELTRKREEAERSYKEFEVRLAGMEQEMERIVHKAIAQAQNEKERILADAERAAEDIKRQAEAAVQGELEDAKRTLREEVAEQAASLAEQLIISNLTAADQIAITEQYLERVGAVQ